VERSLVVAGVVATVIVAAAVAIVELISPGYFWPQKPNPTGNESATRLLSSVARI